MVEFSTTLKLFRITDQWYIVPVKFRFGRNRDFLLLLLLPLAGGPKDGKRFDADWRLISSASFHTSSDNCERNTQKWNSNNKDCKKETIETLMWLRRSRETRTHIKWGYIGQLACVTICFPDMTWQAESRAIGRDWYLLPIIFSVLLLLCIKNLILFFPVFSRSWIKQIALLFMERLHNRDIKSHKCEMTPEKYLHEYMLHAWLAFC